METVSAEIFDWRAKSKLELVGENPLLKYPVSGCPTSTEFSDVKVLLKSSWSMRQIFALSWKQESYLFMQITIRHINFEMSFRFPT